MEWKKEWKPLAIIGIVFLVFFYLPVGFERFDRAVLESLCLVKWYAREHVLLCLVPAFFIADGISVEKKRFFPLLLFTIFSRPGS